MRPSPVNGWPPGAGTTRPPPRRQRGAAPGDQRGAAGSPPPPSLPPPPPRTTDKRRPARGTAAPHSPPPGQWGDPPPKGRGHTAAVRAAVRRVRPVSRPPTPAVPAAGQQHCAGAQGHPVGCTRAAARGTVRCGGRGNEEATRPGAGLGGVEAGTDAERPSRPLPRGPPRPSPRGGAAHQPPPDPRQTDPPAASQTVPVAPGCQKASTEHAAGRVARRHAAGHEGGQEPGPTDQPSEEGGEEPQRDPPPSPPNPPPPSVPRDAGVGPQRRQPSPRPKAREKSALSLKGPRRLGGGMAAKPVGNVPPRPHLPAPRLTMTGMRTRARTQGRHKDHTQDQHANTNRSSMEAMPSRN